MNFKELKTLLETENTTGYFFTERGFRHKVYYYDVPTFRTGSITLVDPRYYCNAKEKKQHLRARLQVPGKSYEEDIAEYLALLMKEHKEESLPSMARWIKRGLEQYYAKEEILAHLEEENLYFDFNSCNEKLVIPIGSYAQKAATAVIPALLKIITELPEYGHVGPILEACYHVRMSWTPLQGSPRGNPHGGHFQGNPHGSHFQSNAQSAPQATSQNTPQAAPRNAPQWDPNVPLSLSLSRKLEKLCILPTLEELKGLDLDVVISEWYGPGDVLLREPIGALTGAFPGASPGSPSGAP